MKYLKMVQTDVELINPQLDSPSVYLSLETKRVVYFRNNTPEPSTQPNNEIWYTTEDNLKFSIGGTEVGMQGYIDMMCNPDPEEGYGSIYAGPTIINEVFEDGVWKIKFAEDVTHVGAEEDFFETERTGITIYPLFDGYEVGTNLTSLSLPKSVTIIDKISFRSGVLLKTFEVPCNVTYIGDYAFAICGWSEEGVSITLPNSVMYLGKELFVESNITNLTYNGTKDQWSAIEKHEDWNYSGSSSDPTAVKIIHCVDGDIAL